ncbi:MAG: tripartite tricarboxylate transporter substrate binding protein, partial [Pseudomonadota bacterium]
GSAAAQQAYPNKPIRIIVPYPPGGSTTTMARIVGQKLTESWGQSVIVDNRGGGNTIIGTEALTKSPPDGYTIFLADATLAVLPHLYRNLPYDSVKDVTPVATISISPQVLVVHPSVPANNLQEFIALAKSRPGQLNFASSGGATTNRLAAELFCTRTGVKMQNIPYKGAGPAITDLIAGQVQLLFNVPINVIPHIKSGRLRPIAITGETRLAALPQVPTFTEAGLPGFDIGPWYGIAVPGGTPKEIIDRLSMEVARVLRMPDVREKLERQGMRPLISTPEQFAAHVKSEMAKFAKIVEIANIKIE